MDEVAEKINPSPNGSGEGTKVVKKTAHTRLQEKLKELVEVAPEPLNEALGQELLQVSKDNNAIILAFIAPYGSVKISPSKQLSAQIGLAEEFGIQLALTQIQEIDRDFNKRPLWLLVQSPGGQVPSSYIISKRLRDTFKEIVVFVPHIAASGGTLIALTGNEVVMGDFSRLGPVDPQVPYAPDVDSEYLTVSANSMERAVQSLSDTLRLTDQDDVPYTYSVLAGKLDPILRAEWSAALLEVVDYLQEMLNKAGYQQKDVNRLISEFVYTSFPHDYVIDKEKAMAFGVKVIPDSKKAIHIELMQEWLTTYMLRQEFRHFIRFITPTMEAKNAAANIE